MSEGETSRCSPCPPLCPTVERRRRDKINNWIVQLSKIIPDCSMESTKSGQVMAGPGAGGRPAFCLLGWCPDVGTHGTAFFLPLSEAPQGTPRSKV